jgi:hypothetical protein
MDYAIISTNVKDEEAYLDEWITYHLSIGFDRIIIYDHRSKVPVENIWGDRVVVRMLDRDSFMLPEYIHNETLLDFPSYWMIVLDPDEFIVCLFEEPDIKEFLKNYESYGALGVPWSVYGSSGHKVKPTTSVKDSYVWREPHEPMWVKSFINTQYCTRTDDPHRGVYTRPSVNEVTKVFEGPITDSPRALIRINHYFTKSYEEYIRKISRGTGDHTPPRPEEWFHMTDKKATVYDDILKDYDKPKIWDGINGWFNFHNFYIDMVGRFDDAVFVEIGCWEGKSTVFMANQIKNSGKNIKFYAIDIWEAYDQGDGNIWDANYDQYLENIEPVKEYINTIKEDSSKASLQFGLESVDFIFIDGNHSYDFIKRDIEHWAPKLKPGGVIAGHDIQWKSIEKAVSEYFGEYEIFCNLWMVDTKKES